LAAIAAMILPGCAQPTPIVIEKEVPVEVEVIKEIVVEKEVPVEVEKEVIVEKKVVETVVVEKEVIKEVVVEPTPEPEKEAEIGVYKIALFEDPLSLNFWNYLGPGSSVWTAYVLTGYSASLFTLSDQRFDFVPSLAKDLVDPVQEGDVWTITVEMVEDAEWSDDELQALRAALEARDSATVRMNSCVSRPPNWLRTSRTTRLLPAWCAGEQTGAGGRPRRSHRHPEKVTVLGPLAMHLKSLIQRDLGCMSAGAFFRPQLLATVAIQ